ncbi:DUF4339 domain-containing protein [Neorhodopirellula lusitana]|uniref:DUF4339 domain-containing protein n=1 Tax=Neorhodopirellula lusitana TaxID=445327 RepID=UPI00385034C3
MNSSPWYLRDSTQTEGPFTEPEIRARLLADAFVPDAQVKQGDSVWRLASEVKEMFAEVYRNGWYIKTRGKIVGPFLATKVIQLHQAGNLPDDAGLRQGTSSDWLPASDGVDEIQKKQATLAKIARLPGTRKAPQKRQAPPQPATSPKRKTEDVRPLFQQAIPILEAIPIATVTPIEAERIPEHHQTQTFEIIDEDFPANPVQHPPQHHRHSPAYLAGRRPPYRPRQGALIAMVSSLTAIACFVGASIWLSPTIAKLTEHIPGIDSHQKVLNDYERFVMSPELSLDETFKLTLSGNRNAIVKSRTREIARMLDRAIKLGPWELETYQEQVLGFTNRLEEYRKQQEEESQKRKLEALEKLKNKAPKTKSAPKKVTKKTTPANQLTPQEKAEKFEKAKDSLRQYIQAMNEAQFLNTALRTAIFVGWCPLSAPESSFQQVQYDIAIVKRDVFFALLKVRSQDDYEKLGEVFEQAIGKIKQIQEENQATLREQKLYHNHNAYTDHFDSIVLQSIREPLAVLYQRPKNRDAEYEYLNLIDAIKREY